MKIPFFHIHLSQQRSKSPWNLSINTQEKFYIYLRKDDKNNLRLNESSFKLLKAPSGKLKANHCLYNVCGKCIILTFTTFQLQIIRENQIKLIYSITNRKGKRNAEPSDLVKAEAQLYSAIFSICPANNSLSKLPKIKHAKHCVV